MVTEGDFFPRLLRGTPGAKAPGLVSKIARLLQKALAQLSCWRVLFLDKTVGRWEDNRWRLPQNVPSCGFGKRKGRRVCFEPFAPPEESDSRVAVNGDFGIDVDSKPDTRQQFQRDPRKDDVHDLQAGWRRVGSRGSKRAQ